jgi:hypothetical protein
MESIEKARCKRENNIKIYVTYAFLPMSHFWEILYEWAVFVEH